MYVTKSELEKGCILELENIDWGGICFQKLRYNIKDQTYLYITIRILQTFDNMLIINNSSTLYYFFIV